jgi:hypothetical protein
VRCHCSLSSCRAPATLLRHPGQAAVPPSPASERRPLSSAGRVGPLCHRRPLPCATHLPRHRLPAHALPPVPPPVTSLLRPWPRPPLSPDAALHPASPSIAPAASPSASPSATSVTAPSTTLATWLFHRLPRPPSGCRACHAPPPAAMPSADHRALRPAATPTGLLHPPPHRPPHLCSVWLGPWLARLGRQLRPTLAPYRSIGARPLQRLRPTDT